MCGQKALLSSAIGGIGREGEGNMGLWEMDMFHIPPRMNPYVENDENGQHVQNGPIH